MDGGGDPEAVAPAAARISRKDWRMTHGYLARLAARAMGQVPGLLPRMPARFEGAGEETSPPTPLPSPPRPDRERGASARPAPIGFPAEIVPERPLTPGPSPIALPAPGRGETRNTSERMDVAICHSEG